MTATLAWPREFIAVAEALWKSGVPRDEIIAKLSVIADEFHPPRCLTLGTLNGFAIRLGWGAHPTSVKSLRRVHRAGQRRRDFLTIL